MSDFKNFLASVVGLVLIAAIALNAMSGRYNTAVASNSSVLFITDSWTGEVWSMGVLNGVFISKKIGRFGEAEGSSMDKSLDQGK